MTRWLDDPEGAADALLAAVGDDMATAVADARVLAAYQYGDGAHILSRRSQGVHSVTVWNRHMRSGRPAAPSPEGNPYDIAVLRLPKPRHEQEMALHQVLAVTRAGGIVYVYGGNDEGIRSFQKTFAGLVSDAETIATRGHGRVMRGTRNGRPVRGEVGDWAGHGTLTLDGGSVSWVSYPGLFAGGALDAGTALLLDALRATAVQGRVLDYGCGPGAIARALQMRSPSLDLTLVDNDSVALVAAAANVPGARLVLADSLARLPLGDPFDMIVSNPPLHSGVREDHAALAALVTDAPARLAPQASLWMVVQRRVPCAPLLEQAFETVGIAAEDASYRVWHAKTPKTPKTQKPQGRARVSNPRRGRPPAA